MKKINSEKLKTIASLAFTFNEQGHVEESISLIYQLIDECYPHLLEKAKTDKTVIYELIKQKNCKDEKLSYEAKIILQYLKNEGLEI